VPARTHARTRFEAQARLHILQKRQVRRECRLRVARIRESIDRRRHAHCLDLFIITSKGSIEA
jgi:hypothetical protein